MGKAQSASVRSLIRSQLGDHDMRHGKVTGRVKLQIRCQHIRGMTEPAQTGPQLRRALLHRPALALCYSGNGPPPLRVAARIRKAEVCCLHFTLDLNLITQKGKVGAALDAPDALTGGSGGWKTAAELLKLASRAKDKNFFKAAEFWTGAEWALFDKAPALVTACQDAKKGQQQAGGQSAIGYAVGIE